MVVWCTQNLRRDGCSFMWHQPCQRCKYTTSVDIQKTRYKKLVTDVESHASAVSLLKRAENSAIQAMIKSMRTKCSHGSWQERNRRPFVHESVAVPLSYRRTRATYTHMDKCWWMCFCLCLIHHDIAHQRGNFSASRLHYWSALRPDLLLQYGFSRICLFYFSLSVENVGECCKA